MITRQLVRFVIVGAAATATYFALTIGLVELHLAGVLIANAIAYGIAFFVSFFGHRAFTFEARHSPLRQGPRYVLTVLSGFGFNQTFMYLVAIRAGLDYRLSAILAAGLVAVGTFVLSKFWVFKPEGTSAKCG